MNKRKLYQVIAAAVQARLNCERSGNEKWHGIWSENLSRYGAMLPSGGGFGNDSSIDLDLSNGEKLVFKTSYHHMDQMGGYDGWTDHKIIVTPSFAGYDMIVKGRNKNGIKEYIAECFDAILDMDAELEEKK